MPCSDGLYYDQLMREEANKRKEEQLVALKNRCDELARLLCEAMQIIEGSEDTSGPAIAQASANLQRWWKEHKEFDKKRGAR